MVEFCLILVSVAENGDDDGKDVNQTQAARYWDFVWQTSLIMFGCCIFRTSRSFTHNVGCRWQVVRRWLCTESVQTETGRRWSLLSTTRDLWHRKQEHRASKGLLSLVVNEFIEEEEDKLLLWVLKTGTQTKLSGKGSWI